MSPGRSLLLALMLIAVACSPRSAIDAFSSPEDRAFAQDFVAKMRSGDVSSLESRFDAATWRQSASQFRQVPALYPRSGGTTELIGYHVATNTTNGATTQIKDYSLVTHDASHWTTTVIRTQSNQNEPHRIIGWNVVGSPEMPPAYRQFRSMEAAVPWIQGGALVTFLLGVGLVIWLVRRSRRKRAASQSTGTP